MRRLKLRYLGSYSGHGVEVTQRDPVIEVEDPRAKVLLATGYFEDLGGEPGAGAAAAPAEASEPPAPEAVPGAEPVRVQAPAGVPGPITTASLPPRVATQAPAPTIPRPQAPKRPPGGSNKRRK
jgi:hypothetical protein